MSELSQTNKVGELDVSAKDILPHLLLNAFVNTWKKQYLAKRDDPYKRYLLGKVFDNMLQTDQQ